MTTRTPIAYTQLDAPWQAMLSLHRAVDGGPLGARLLALVRTRVSQLNGCAYCLDLHITEARRAGEDQRRLDVLAAWRETSLFDDRERAALAFAEAVTLLADGGVPDVAVGEVEARFETDEVASLLYAVAEINAWNRLVAAARTPLPDRGP